MSVTPTAELMTEHQAILRMLRVLDSIGERLEAEEDVSAGDLDRIVEFIRVFADSCHHAKEEDLLFTEMEKAGLPREGGPISVMMQEHEMGRSFVSGLAGAVERYRQGDQEAGRSFADNAHNYTSLLTSHIEKEDNILYPMAVKSLSPEQNEALTEGFERIERERIGAGKHEEFHHLIEELERKYL